jgi:hypothetical protein
MGVDPGAMPQDWERPVMWCRAVQDWVNWGQLLGFLDSVFSGGDRLCQPIAPSVTIHTQHAKLELGPSASSLQIRLQRGSNLIFPVASFLRTPLAASVLPGYPERMAFAPTARAPEPFLATCQ